MFQPLSLRIQEEEKLFWLLILYAFSLNATNNLAKENNAMKQKMTTIKIVVVVILWSISYLLH